MRCVSRDLGAGVCLLGIAAVATWQGAGLELGSLRQMGPGMFPRVVAVLVGVCGGALGLRAWLQSSAAKARAPAVGAQVAAAGGDEGGGAKGSGGADSSSGGVRQQAWRAPLFLLLAAAAFSLSVRALGLLVAAPLALVVAALASPDSRRGQTAWFALGMTVFCVVLFRLLLSLPIPLAPWLIGY